LSSDILPRASLFAQYADQASSTSAMQNLQMMKMTGRVPFTGNQMMDMQIQTSAYMQFKQEALKALKQQETNLLNEKEKEIRLELNTVQQQLATKKEQLQAYKQACKEAAKNAAPDFG
jgi:outer membrane protein TolC